MRLTLQVGVVPDPVVQHFQRITDHNESIRVDPPDQGFQVADLWKSDHGEDDAFLDTFVSSLAVQNVVTPLLISLRISSENSYNRGNDEKPLYAD
jgi:hypothetical protein